MKKLFGMLMLVTLLFSGCGKPKYEINIAQQYGIAYAPLAIMEQKHFLEDSLPGIKVNWKQFGGPTSIREGMLSGDIDIGFMGAAPVLVGIDNVMPWRYACGISANEVAIVTDNPNVNTLADFTKKDRIAILSPACTQHVLLCMLAREQLGDPHILDVQTVSMSHPDAASALIANTEITAHVSTPPYISEELKAGAHKIATGKEIMGEHFTFITGVAMEDFHRERPKEYAAFITALEKSISYINDNMDEAVKILAPLYDLSEGELKEQMTYEGTIYSTRLEGTAALSKAMYEMGFIKNNLKFEDVTFDNVNKE
ncbi:MAG: ABC transporter substrate-binding protein [Oscillospiraceae bacterium]